MQDNEFETKENKIWIKDKIEPQHRYENYFQVFDSISLLVLRSLMRYSIDHSKKNLLEMASVTPFLGDECTT